MPIIVKAPCPPPSLTKVKPSGPQYKRRYLILLNACESIKILSFGSLMFQLTVNMKLLERWCVTVSWVEVGGTLTNKWVPKPYVTIYAPIRKCKRTLWNYLRTLWNYLHCQWQTLFNTFCRYTHNIQSIKLQDLIFLLYNKGSPTEFLVHSETVPLSLACWSWDPSLCYERVYERLWEPRVLLKWSVYCSHLILYCAFLFVIRLNNIKFLIETMTAFCFCPPHSLS